MLSEAELADMEQAARESTTFPWVRGYLLALLAEVRRLRAENDALREQVVAQQAGANADRATAVELLGRRAEKPLAWSQDPPTAPGWYWWRDLPAQRERPVFVFHANVATGPLVTDRAGVVRPVAEPGGEWAGPLAPPAC